MTAEDVHGPRWSIPPFFLQVRGAIPEAASTVKHQIQPIRRFHLHTSGPASVGYRRCTGKPVTEPPHRVSGKIATPQFFERLVTALILTADEFHHPLKQLHVAHGSRGFPFAQPHERGAAALHPL